MFYNYSLAPYFLLLFVGFMATLKGFTTIKVRLFESPIGDYSATGQEAVLWGTAFVVVGLGSWAMLVWVLVS